jgi:hypothetical protein
MKLYIVCYEHRHGVDVWPIFVRPGEPAPTAEDVIEGLSNWEGDSREDEFLEVQGPFDIPYDPSQGVANGR